MILESAAGDGVRPDPGLDFEGLLRRYQSRVFSIVVHHTGDTGVAEEVAQDVFLRLHAELPRIHSEAHAVSWLRRVAVHRAIDASHSGHFRRTHHLEGVAEPSDAASPPDVLLRRALRRVAATLPDPQRMANVHLDGPINLQDLGELGGD